MQKLFADYLRLPAVDFDVKAFTNIIDMAKVYLQQRGAIGLLIVFGLLVMNLFVTYFGGRQGLFHLGGEIMINRFFCCINDRCLLYITNKITGLFSFQASRNPFLSCIYRNRIQLSVRKNNSYKRKKAQPEINICVLINCNLFIANQLSS